jgi:hypothetical protein
MHGVKSPTTFTSKNILILKGDALLKGAIKYGL